MSAAKAWQGAAALERRVAGERQVASYEEAFAKIRAATGVADTEELTRRFVAQEEENFKAFTQLNELNAEVERAEEALAELRFESERFRGQVT